RGMRDTAPPSIVGTGEAMPLDEPSAPAPPAPATEAAPVGHAAEPTPPAEPGAPELAPASEPMQSESTGPPPQQPGPEVSAPRPATGRGTGDRHGRWSPRRQPARPLAQPARTGRARRCGPDRRRCRRGDRGELGRVLKADGEAVLRQWPAGAYEPRQRRRDRE